MSIFRQVPLYFTISCAEVFFTFVGKLEFFYEQARDAKRGPCSALSLVTVALGQYWSSLVTIVTKISTRNEVLNGYLMI
ncbi:NRT1/ PTR FAMILY 8.1 [Spatholobus suberectus]|nr:NRT1/ PTR FAMILY 8.1 [Spatholobus suberectus]